VTRKAQIQLTKIKEKISKSFRKGQSEGQKLIGTEKPKKNYPDKNLRSCWQTANQSCFASV